MYDPLGIANRNIWLIVRPYTILLWLWCVAASIFGLLMVTAAAWIVSMYAVALGCFVGWFFMMIAGLTVTVIMFRDYEVEPIWIEVHC